MAEVPKHLVVISAGVIGLEFGSVWRRLAAKVTVVEYLDHVAHGTDLEAGKPCNPRSLARALRSSPAQKSPRQPRRITSDHGVSLSVEPADGEEAELIEADYVLVSIRRRPYTNGLELETIGLSIDKRGMLENRGHRTAAENVWVIGDATSGPMLAHKAEDEATICLGRIVGEVDKVNYNLIPNVIYTRPSWRALARLKSNSRLMAAPTRLGNSRSAPTVAQRSITRLMASPKFWSISGQTKYSACIW